MSDEDYQAGLRGENWNASMDQAAHAAGKAVHDRKQAMSAPQAPKTPVSGPGFTAVICAPFLAVMYPTMGALVLVAAFAGGLLVNAVWPAAGNATALVSLVCGVAVLLLYGFKAEHALSRYKIYRVARHVLRLIVLGGFVAQLLMTDFNNSFLMTPQQAFSQASGGAIFGAIVAVVVMHFLFGWIDRIFFPVRDSYVIAQERKYAGLEPDEIFAIKNAKFRGMRAFALSWLAATIVLMFAVPDAPVAVWAAGTFIVLWFLRGRLFFKLHRQRLAEAAVLREQRGGPAWSAASANTDVRGERAA